MGEEVEAQNLFVGGLFVCLFVCFLFFWRAGTDEHEEDEIGNHVNFKSFFFISRKHNTRKKE